ncbi:MAG: hydrogenase maturation protease [Elusimicrobiota bacterium]
MRTRLLALGNDILSDDGVGLAVGRAVQRRFGERVELVESSRGGLALVELLSGCDQALILDAIMTGEHPAGTILELETKDLGCCRSRAPHLMSLGEAMELGRTLDQHLPAKLRIVAMEVKDTMTVGTELSPEVSGAMDAYADRIAAILESWGLRQAPSPAAAHIGA